MLVTAKEKLTSQIAYLVKNSKIFSEPDTNCILDIFIAAGLFDQQIDYYMGMQVSQGLQVRVKGRQGK